MPVSVRRAAIGLLLVDVLAVALIARTMRSARRFADRSEETFVTLARDVTRASQAQATAERMVAIGRGYMLTVEPELLVRSQAAEAKLARTLQTLAAGRDGDDQQSLAPVLAAAKQYRSIFSALLSGEEIPREPREVAQALRKQLIPARDDLLGELDTLISGKLSQLEAVRAAAREERTRALSIAVGAGAFAVLASGFLLWILLADVRDALASAQLEQPHARKQSPHGVRLASVHRFPQKHPPPRRPT